LYIGLVVQPFGLCWSILYLYRV